jgi:hypothetical protein
MMLCRLAIVVLLLSIVGCAGPLYRPFDGRIGYSEAEVEPGIIDVIYQAPEGESQGRTIELAKIRAAEVALERGFDHFQILGRGLDIAEDVEVSYDYVGPYDRDNLYPRRRTGVPVYDVRHRPVAVLTVRLLEESNDSSFAAEEIIRSAYARGLLEPVEEE